MEVERSSVDVKIFDGELPQVGRLYHVSLLLVDVAIQPHLGVGVREGSLQRVVSRDGGGQYLFSHLWLEVVGQHLNRVPNVKTLQVLGILVDVMESLNLQTHYSAFLQPLLLLSLP